MLLSLLERMAARRRRPGAHPAWSAVAFAAFLVRWHQKRVGKDAVVLREELQPGETLIIEHTRQRRG